MYRPYGAANGRWKICYYDKNGTGDFWGNIGGSGLFLKEACRLLTAPAPWLETTCNQNLP